MVAKSKDVRIATDQENHPAPRHVLGSFENIDRVFDEFMHSPLLGPFRRGSAEGALNPFEVSAPRLDIIDRDDKIVVRAELPGVNKDDIEIALTDNLFTLKGQFNREDKQEEGDYYRCERAHGSFSRTVSLPAGVNEKGASAKLDNGILEVSLPKAAESRKRAIHID